ncbi:MAG: hypothetical protein WD555_03810 [Fulvivirga sp.]
MSQYTDLTYLKELTDNDEMLISESLNRYLNTSSVQTEKLVKSAGDKDWEEIHNSAHSLYTTTQIVGLRIIAQDLKDIQRISREEQDHKLISEKVDKVNQVIQASQEELKNYLIDQNL